MEELTDKIALGAVQFGLNYGISNKNGVTPINEVGKILEFAKKSRISVIDTAYSYGDSEKNLGEFDLEQFKIVSKFPETEGVPIFQFFNESCKRLNVSSLYGYIAHNGNILINNVKAWDELKELKNGGKVEKIGYSLYKPRELEILLDLGMIPDLIQVPFNLLDRRFEEYFDELKKMGCEIHSRSTFLQGIFFLSLENLSSFFEPLRPFLTHFDKRFPDMDDKISYLISFVLRNNGIDKLVLGVNNQSQLRQNINHLSNTVTDEYELNLSAIPEEILLPYNWPAK
ncbi:Predicted oxidoreductase [Ekhidna lutea]|uniref:Predicted oxidoreductase n=1 Tax=Ekhidna lutea TaxID=447679 RepID=A0A239FJ63_EKHLU|nr:aldo/keto reductase [Ekhidna lutea]SNS56104.1 Predicted oxidoreductase [Ekhidna lutea]